MTHHWHLIDPIIDQALREDMPYGDVSAAAVLPEPAPAVALVTAKAPGVVAGLLVGARTFQRLDPDAQVELLARDGERVLPGRDVMRIRCDARALLSAERTALNLMQRMSGIATAVREFVDALRGYDTVVADTRKTAPGLRVLDKLAVLMGGGRNHRFGLSDGVMLKDNHIALAGGVAQAVHMARQRVSHTMTIEVEAKTLEQVEEAVNAGADIIMLDNMPPEVMARAVQIARGRAIIEASGNMTVQRALEAARLGVQVVSVGSVTHSARALDLSLNVISPGY
ncbi:carboxylating nicotinate-nucleotide diphosphorylase [Thermanaerovibrio acidaminovorans]|jgi:nicotinate-nucleotide pyrophosphorylase (carboxylating)|uniref:Probable nicotinate-nucleotide pyrophosphorylase [carboxylating] n=1 Tax=Thermanaerovibrio acidaminovorans (strain ATCC 49978 / DSM 6589 / Su883) TaxID=525903 RepID=D1B7H8_THEAS|nr:carboxylating nicotinate-nucleotide diphosphorylase [Thermanaerovibrio acidaminovorans]ACZ19969.1 nicotinate-nucleotide pyrophosphorylase [Thermanaerovibrio acidaminovorans DSM 6589]